MSSSRSAEVVVVGAGPGGSVAAAHLARSGREVVLLEAQSFPRHKVCGDVLLPEVDESLREVGTSLDQLAGDARLLEGCRYIGARGRRAQGRFADALGRIRPWRILRREVFDERLASHAASCGAELRERHRLLGVEWDPVRRRNRLRIATPDGVRYLISTLVIGADGAASRVARERNLGVAAADLAPGLCVGLRGYVPWADADPYLTVIGHVDLVPGCAWVVPQADGWANVGVGTIERHRRARKLGLHRSFHELLPTCAPLAAGVRGLQGWQLPTGGCGRRAAADGVLLVGDAAALVDPFTGHGIHNAVHSALLAGRVADEALRRGDNRRASGPIGRYERLLRRRLGRELALGRWLQRFHARGGLVDLALARAQVSQRWADRFMGVVGHALPRAGILRPGFAIDLLRPTGSWRTEVAPGP